MKLGERIEQTKHSLGNKIVTSALSMGNKIVPSSSKSSFHAIHSILNPNDKLPNSSNTSTHSPKGLEKNNARKRILRNEGNKNGYFA